jgi:hypothetical protein
MAILTAGEPYKPNSGKTAELQPAIDPLPRLRKSWFKNKITCDEGWYLTFSGSSWRIDRYDYYENGRHLVLGGEGATGQMDIFVGPQLAWDDSPCELLDESTQWRALHNITAALQFAGFQVGIFRTSS